MKFFKFFLKFLSNAAEFTNRNRWDREKNRDLTIFLPFKRFYYQILFISNHKKNFFSVMKCSQWVIIVKASRSGEEKCRLVNGLLKRVSLFEFYYICHDNCMLVVVFVNWSIEEHPASEVRPLSDQTDTLRRGGGRKPKNDFRCHDNFAFSTVSR